jgi:prefoldin subunit 5
MTEDTLNIEEIKMHNKTVSKILVAIIMTSMLIAVLPTLPVGAVTLSSITPDSGNVGDTVALTGTIDTLGGAYTIWFDLNSNNVPDAGEDIVTDNAPANSFTVEDTFVVPACLGSDAGLAHRVWLQDNQTTSVQFLAFDVITSRTLEVVPSYEQEGNSVAVTIAVTGGTLGNTLNSFDVEVTAPDDSVYTGEVSFSTDPAGSGSATTDLFPNDFSEGANTLFTGTYNVVADRTLPGEIPNWDTTTFDIGLTNATSYSRFEIVNVQTDGWENNQNVTITITDPSDAVAYQWLNVNTTDGTSIVGDWEIPWNAPLGTYTITAVNATGDNKDVDSTQTFTVGSANLVVDFVDDPMVEYQRTETVDANFTIMYPDGTFLNDSQASSIEVRVYANTTMVDSMMLTPDDYDDATDNWAVSWKIPRDASLGSNYKFHLDVDTIADTNDNMGPTAATPSGSFTVNMAELMVMVTEQPAANYTRTGDAMAKINITYPDDSFYTDADLGEILVRVYLVNTTNVNVANVTLMPEHFDATTNEWTIIWNSAYDATLGDYFFELNDMEVYDAANPNMGPVADVATDSFELLEVDIIVDAIMTGAATYAPGEYLSVFFDAIYADGTPVTTGEVTVWLTAPDTYTMTSYTFEHTVNGRYAKTIWLSDAQAQVGAWTVTLQAMNMTDDAGNMGPAEEVTTNFTVTPAEVSLDSLMAAIDALSDKVDGIEADTNGLGSSVGSLQSTVGALQSSIVSIAELVADLQTQVDSLSATAATDADVAAVSSALSAVSSDLSTLDSKLNSLSTAVGNAATEADVTAAVQAAVDSLTADIDALETKMNTLSSTASSSADLDAATEDLTGQIGGLNTLVIVAVVLALIAAIAAILAVYIIQRKIAG